MRKDISCYVKDCKICATQKDERHKEFWTTVRIPIAKLPWQKVQLNFINGLASKE